MIELLGKPSAQRRTRKAAIAAAVAASAATLFASVPAATAAPSTVTADPSSQIKITSSALDYGAANDSVFTFTPYFYARSALVEGTLRADGCVRAYASTYAGPSRRLDYKSTSLKCNTTVPVKLELKADIPGGADRILVEIRDSATNLIASGWVYR